MTVRTRYLIAAAVAIPLGVVSRLYPLGWTVYDKYLGDALYAVMVYLVLGWIRPRISPYRLAPAALLVNVAIELFQLTGVALELSRSPSAVLRLVSIVLGTTFAWLDLVAYGVGIGCVFLWDLALRRSARADAPAEENHFGR